MTSFSLMAPEGIGLLGSLMASISRSYQSLIVYEAGNCQSAGPADEPRRDHSHLGVAGKEWARQDHTDQGLRNKQGEEGGK